jgi:homogentisate 1,2-dioxygenase
LPRIASRLPRRPLSANKRHSDPIGSVAQPALHSCYSITSSARASIIGGISMPSGLGGLQVDDEFKLGRLQHRHVDGEMLFVLQQGELRLWTEFGIIDIEPGEIAVIPRGVKIRVELRNGAARGASEPRLALRNQHRRPALNHCHDRRIGRGAQNWTSDCQ